MLPTSGDISLQQIYDEARSYVNGNGVTVFNYPFTSTISFEDLSNWDGWVPELEKPLPPHLMTKFYGREAKKDLYMKATVYNFISDPTGFEPNFDPFPVTLDYIIWNGQTNLNSYGGFSVAEWFPGSTGSSFYYFSDSNDSIAFNKSLAPNESYDARETFLWKTETRQQGGSNYTARLNNVRRLQIKVKLLDTNTTPVGMTPGYTKHDVIVMEGWLTKNHVDASYTLDNDVNNKVSFSKVADGNDTVFTGNLYITGHDEWGLAHLDVALGIYAVG